MPSTTPDNQVHWFRNSSPYINAHRGRTFVVMLSGELLDGPRLPTLIHDLALLNSLGIKLVLVHGARPQISARLAESGIDYEIVPGVSALCSVAISAGVPVTHREVASEVVIRSGHAMKNCPNVCWSPTAAAACAVRDSSGGGTRRSWRNVPPKKNR